MTERVDDLAFSDLREANIARQEYWGGSDNWTLADWSNALAGEVGEACNVVKKIRRPQLGTIGNDADAPKYYAQLESEIGDVLIYLDLLAKAAGLDLATCVSRAFNEKSEKLGMPVRLASRRAADKEPGTGEDGLLPCPFCGGEARIVEGEESAYVQCSQMKMHRALWFGGDNNAAHEVREEWNRRAHPSPAQGVSEALRTLSMLVLQSDLYRSDMDVRDAVDAGISLTAALGAQPAEVEGWRTMDSAPSGKVVLLWKPPTKEQYVAARVDGGHGPGWCTPDGFEIFGATHWRPLPHPPITGDAK